MSEGYIKNNEPEPLTFTAVLSELKDIKQLLLGNTDRWLNVDELCNYLPGRPKKKAIYDKVQARSIPFVREGRHLGFLKSDIDLWLKSKTSKPKIQSRNRTAVKKGGNNE